MFGLRQLQESTEHTGSYYAASANSTTQYPRLENDVSCDVVVVGGGFSGTNTALELAERGFDVVLLEANRISWGASGRNGGQIIGGIGHDPERFVKSIGARMSRSALNSTRPRSRSSRSSIRGAAGPRP